MFRNDSISVLIATSTPPPTPTGLGQRTLPENKMGTRPAPSEPGSRPVGLPAWVEAHSSETAEKATEEKQEGARNKQSGATQSQLLLRMAKGREGGMNEREGRWRIFLWEDILSPEPRAIERSPHEGRGLSTSSEQPKGKCNFYTS